MALITGTPLGQINSQEDLYLEGAPNLYYQLDTATPLNNPDSDGFYWGMSGTVAAPVIALGCVDTVALADNLTMNDVMCDTVGVKDTLMRRNYLEFTLNISTLFSLSTIRDILRAGAVTSGSGLEKMGIGVIDNSRRFMVYGVKVYDESVGDHIMFHAHKCKFVDAWNLGFTYGNAWKLTGIRIRAFAKDTYPSTQQFMTVVRSDPSAIV
jgi:hypothetical protein